MLRMTAVVHFSFYEIIEKEGEDGMIPDRMPSAGHSPSGRPGRRCPGQFPSSLSKKEVNPRPKGENLPFCSRFSVSYGNYTCHSVPEARKASSGCFHGTASPLAVPLPRIPHS